MDVAVILDVYKRQILQDGETIGFTAEQKISISQSKGVAVNGTTLKLGY